MFSGLKLLINKKIIWQMFYNKNQQIQVLIFWKDRPKIQIFKIRNGSKLLQCHRNKNCYKRLLWTIVHKLDNLEEMDQLQETYTPPNLYHVKIKKKYIWTDL